MIEELTKDNAHRAFPAGGMVLVIPPDAPRNPSMDMMIPSILDAWKGGRFHVTLRAKEEEPALEKGAQIEIMTSRIDGVYRLPGIIEEMSTTQHTTLSRPEYTLQVKAVFRKGSREQHRQSFRVGGEWSAAICLRPDPSQPDRHPVIHPGKIWNLSIGGCLLRDPDGLLHEGGSFLIQIDLGDGGEPLRLGAQAVRRDPRVGSDVSQWGCQFTDVRPDQESRIARFLQEKIRAHLAASRAGQSGS